MNDRGRLDERFSRFLHTSLDGIVDGPNGAMDIGFVHYNVELEQFAKQVTANADTILWGRATYEMMYQYWPNMLNNEEGSEHERAHAAWIDAVEKIVCSRTLQETAWNHSTLIHEQITEKFDI